MRDPVYKAANLFATSLLQNGSFAVVAVMTVKKTTWQVLSMWFVALLGFTASVYRYKAAIWRTEADRQNIGCCRAAVYYSASLITVSLTSVAVNDAYNRAAVDLALPNNIYDYEQAIACYFQVVFNSKIAVSIVAAGFLLLCMPLVQCNSRNSRDALALPLAGASLQAQIL